jgi:hypothetical protein
MALIEMVTAKGENHAILVLTVSPHRENGRVRQSTGI